MTIELFPPIPLDAWRDTKETLHRMAQVIGKIRLASSPRRNHWWNVPFHLTGRGITTRPMGMVDGNPLYSIDFDFVSHRVVVQVVDGRAVHLPLMGISVADFYAGLMAALESVGVRPRLAHPFPFDLPDAGRPFAEDREHAAYDPFWVNRYWVVLSQVGLLLETFAAGYSGKVSPVHHFWHTFDLAVTRFSPKEIAVEAADPVTREAYSREVISSGFWFGDARMAEPAFYSYTAPEPAGLADQRLQPAQAGWVAQNGSHLAVLTYDDARRSADPWTTVLGFLESAYRQGAALAGWDTDRLACPGGVTDPQLLSRR